MVTLCLTVHDCCSCSCAYARDVHSPVHSCASVCCPRGSKSKPLTSNLWPLSSGKKHISAVQCSFQVALPILHPSVLTHPTLYQILIVGVATGQWLSWVASAALPREGGFN